MTADNFNDCVATQINHCTRLLCSKGEEYAPGYDRLSAFKKAAAIQNCSQAQAAFGMLAKHLVSVADMVHAPGAFPAAKWDEKIGDSINYLLIIRAIIEEEASANATY